MRQHGEEGADKVIVVVSPSTVVHFEHVPFVILIVQVLFCGRDLSLQVVEQSEQILR